nr:heme oxygenase [Rhizobium sp. Q54]
MDDERWPLLSPVLDRGYQLAPLVRRDLLDLGMDVPATDDFAVPAVDREVLLGMLYVVEGSSLGARVLYRQAQQLGLSGSFGARHLAAQAESVERWREVVRLLEEAPDLNLDSMVEASELVFAAAGHAFEDLQDA